jgi:hypothetical protein
MLHNPSSATEEVHTLQSERSNSRRTAQKKPQKAVSGWTAPVVPNPIGGLENTYSNEPTSSRIPRLTSNTSTTSQWNGRIMERSKTQEKLKGNLVSRGDSEGRQDFASEKHFDENLQRANSEISKLRKELRMKNSELMKLKKAKGQQKWKTPHDQTVAINANNMGSTRRPKVNTRLAVGEKSNSPSEEYYETTKLSPTSSYSNSVYSKGMGQKIKSSQSCRQTNQDHPTNLPLQNNNLCAVKEIEEEQMAETFTKMNKKFSQPQQKEISKKNTPRQKRKIVSEGVRITSRGKNNSRENSNRKIPSRGKGNKKSEVQSIEENLKMNFKFSKKPMINTIKVPDETQDVVITENGNKINLPSIVKPGENSMKFDHSLVGFATRSLSKNGMLKIQQKSTNNLNKTNNKSETNSGITFNSKNSLINVPKKYQFRGKRLNIDCQSITSSGKSGITTETFKNQNVFHTKSGPIQTNETLWINSTENQPLYKTRKLKLKDYKIKQISSPSERLSNDTEKPNLVQKPIKGIKKKADKKLCKAVKPVSTPKTPSAIKEIPTDELIKRRIEMLNLEEDDEGIDKQREYKKREAKRQLLLMESINSRYRKSKDKENQGVKYSIRKFDHPKVISLDSKMHGSLLQGKSLLLFFREWEARWGWRLYAS